MPDQAIKALSLQILLSQVTKKQAMPVAGARTEPKSFILQSTLQFELEQKTLIERLIFK